MSFAPRSPSSPAKTGSMPRAHVAKKRQAVTGSSLRSQLFPLALLCFQQLSGLVGILRPIKGDDGNEPLADHAGRQSAHADTRIGQQASDLMTRAGLIRPLHLQGCQIGSLG